MPPLGFKGRIAIVIDDCGYSLNNLAVIEGIGIPLSASVLPGLTYSAVIARQLHARGWEVILHLPMEPKEKYRLEKNTILTSLNEEKIRSIINRDLKDIIYAKGVSNHMGSRATEDTKTMQAVFRILKGRGMYFLDSLVSARSVCRGLARKMKLSFAQRDVFLDNRQDAVYIRRQLDKLKLKAKSQKYAIGIGHDRRLTLAVLKEAIPQLQQEGYRFVFVSELAHKPDSGTKSLNE
jgi:polysaccharide deacetylase 2 family uncharacterized protein YibQ